MIDVHLSTWAMLATDGWFEVRWSGDGSSMRDAADPEALCATLRACHPDVWVGLPRARRKPGAVCSPVSAFWAQTASKASWRLLSRFRPEPTLILREGESARLTAFWALRRPLRDLPGLPAHAQAVEANRRIARFLRAPQTCCDPDEFYFRPHGSRVVQKRREVPVQAIVCEPRLYAAATVVKHLPPAPDKDAWRERA